MSELAPLARLSLPDQIFRSLSASILGGNYRPGEKLPTQRALAKEFGTNMTTVREAVKKLEQLRLIEVRQGDAMRVRDWRRHGGLDIVAHMIFAAGAIDLEVLKDVLEARRLLLTQCARLAAERATSQQAELLLALADRIAGAEADQAQLIDFEYFELLAEASGNLVFLLIINSIREVYIEHAAAFSVIVADRSDLNPLYRELATSVLAGEADAAGSAAAELAASQERRLIEFVLAVTTP